MREIGGIQLGDPSRTVPDGAVGEVASHVVEGLGKVGGEGLLLRGDKGIGERFLP